MTRKVLLLLLVLTAVLVLSACGGESLECDDPLGCVEVAPGDPILLASSLVVSGPNTELGLDSQWGVELAIDFREEILGHAIELQAEDDGCSAEGGQTSARRSFPTHRLWR